MERDDGVVAGVGQGGVALRGRLAAARGAWLVFADEAGFSMTPPRAKTWSQRGRTPVVQVCGRSRGRISIAAPSCYKPGRRAKLIYRPRHDDGRRDGRKSFSWRDYRDLLITAHQQLGGPIVLVWDNLNVHKAADLHKFAEARDCRPTHPTSTQSRGSVPSCDAAGSSSASGAAYGTSSTAANALTAASPRPAWQSDLPEQRRHITSSTSVMQGGRECLGQGHGRAADQAAQVAGVGVHLAAVHTAVSVGEDLRQLGG